jgi:hypothetical protein
LKERIINDLKADAEVKAEGVENASSWHLWRIRCNFIIVVTCYLRVDIIFIELFSLFRFDEKKIKKIYKAFPKLRK